ncbi:type II secretion system F family protein [Lacunimicrobium album]
MFDTITNIWTNILAAWTAYPLLRLTAYALFAYVMYRLLRRAINKQIALNQDPNAPKPAKVAKPVKAAKVKPVKAQPLASTTPVVEPAPVSFATPVVESDERLYTPPQQPASSQAHYTFSVFDNDHNQDLPRIEPGDLPVTNSSDMAYGGVTPMLASLLPESNERKRETKKELQHAGYYEPHAYQNLAASRYIGVMLPIVGSLLLLVFGPPEAEFIAIGAMLVLPLLGWSLPRLFLRGKAKSRLAEIEQGFPDMLDMLNMCVSQGLPILPSLKRVGHELEDIYPALAQELRITYEQAELGSTQQALENFRDRVDLPDVNSFTSLLTQTERMGTSISNALTQYSDNMRETLKQRADSKANTATFKLLFPTVLCLVPAVYLFLLGPAIVDLSEFFYGGGSQVLTDNTNAVSEVLRNEN